MNTFKNAISMIFIVVTLLLINIMFFGAFLIPENFTNFHDLNPVSKLKNRLYDDSKNIETVVKMGVFFVVASTIGLSIYGRYSKGRQKNE